MATVTRMCATPKCAAPPVDESRFCSPCAARLAEIREVLQSDSRRLKRGGLAVRGLGTCRHPGCGERRPHGESFCALHRAEGDRVAE